MFSDWALPSAFPWCPPHPRGGRHPGGENPTPRMGAVLLGGTQFNYLGRSQNPKHPYLNGAVAGFALYSRAEPPDAAS